MFAYLASRLRPPSTVAICIAALLLGGLGCTGDALDLGAIEGGYSGRWTWRLGDGPITMTVESSTTMVHLVRFYETAAFVPQYNTDGVTPEATGNLTVNDAQLSLSLNLRTDDPRCVGTYLGSGVHNRQRGTLEFDMSIVHDCAEDGSAVFVFTKVTN